MKKLIITFWLILLIIITAVIKTSSKKIDEISFQKSNIENKNGFFGVNYNVLRIENGFGGLLFS